MLCAQHPLFLVVISGTLLPIISAAFTRIRLGASSFAFACQCRKCAVSPLPSLILRLCASSWMRPTECWTWVGDLEADAGRCWLNGVRRAMLLQTFETGSSMNQPRLARAVIEIYSPTRFQEGRIRNAWWCILVQPWRRERMCQKT